MAVSAALCTWAWSHREPTNGLTPKEKQLFLPQQLSTTYSSSGTGEAWRPPPHSILDFLTGVILCRSYVVTIAAVGSRMPQTHCVQGTASNVHFLIL